VKAIVQSGYGSAGVLTLREIETPIPGPSQVLVRVRATAVNIGDWHMLRGVPYVMRAGLGLRKPKRQVPGLDLAGQVAAVGEDVARFRVGDEVFGWGRRTFAEYACVAEDNLLPKPTRLSLEDSAAVGDSAFTALAAVRDQGNVGQGQRLLINGASGAVGTFAVQIAKTFGAEVTGVCSTKNVEFVRSIGADEVIDYTQHGFTERGQPFDVMLDMVGNRPLSDCRQALKATGTYVIVGVKDLGRWFGMGRQIKALSMSPFVHQRLRVFLVKHSLKDLATLSQLVESDALEPVIDRRYPLAEASEAFRYVGTGHARGKVILEV
jgi:NADPH:quinone reductase-like Zn-dependent oxidoreductase